MAESAYTKGPLAIHHQSAPCTISGFYHVTEAGKDRCALAYVHLREDAALYSAAPDLFEALKDALRSSRKDFKVGPDGDRQHREAYAQQFAALRRALGKEG